MTWRVKHSPDTHCSRRVKHSPDTLCSTIGRTWLQHPVRTPARNLSRRNAGSLLSYLRTSVAYGKNQLPPPPTTRARAPTQHGTHTFHQQQLHTGKETAFAHTAVWAFSKGRFHVTGNFECIYARTRYSILRLFLNPHAVRVVGVVGDGPSHHSYEQVAEQHLCARARATDRSCEDVHAHVRRARPCAQ